MLYPVIRRSNDSCARQSGNCRFCFSDTAAVCVALDFRCHIAKQQIQMLYLSDVLFPIFRRNNNAYGR
jgi:hypothetical protein